VFGNRREKLSLGVEYRSWNFEDIVEINALRGTVELNFPEIVFSLTPQFRNITYTLKNASGSRETEAHIDSTGYNTNLTLYLPGNVWMSGAYASHIYNDEIFIFNQSRSFFDVVQRVNLSPAIMNNTYGLEKNRTSVGLGIDFATAGMSVSWSESISAVDEETTVTIDAGIYWSMDKHWRIKLSGGAQTNSINDDQISFGIMSLKYRF
jgi:hypothetical protein